MAAGSAGGLVAGGLPAGLSAGLSGLSDSFAVSAAGLMAGLASDGAAAAAPGGGNSDGEAPSVESCTPSTPRKGSVDVDSVSSIGICMCSFSPPFSRLSARKLARSMRSFARSLALIARESCAHRWRPRLRYPAVQAAGGSGGPILAKRWAFLRNRSGTWTKTASKPLETDGPESL